MDKKTGIQDDGTGSLPCCLVEAVERFCLEQVDLRSRLARIGGEAERQAQMVARGCDAHGTGPWAS